MKSKDAGQKGKEVRDRVCQGDTTLQVNNTFVGYGRTEEAARNDFFRTVLEGISARLNCGQGTCENTLTCVAEILKTKEIEPKVICNRIQLPGSPQKVGWKCFLHDQPGDTTDVGGRCTCAPRAV